MSVADRGRGSGAAPQLGTGEAVVFWILGPIALAAAVGMVLSRNAVHAALFLVTMMMSLAVFYVVQEAPFLGAVQIIVYTGAIMMLFLFVLMLVGRDSSDSLVETLRGQRVAAILAGRRLRRAAWAPASPAPRGDQPAQGLARRSGEATSRRSPGCCSPGTCFAFEVTSALLITAAVGAMVLAHIERDPAPAVARRSCRGPLPRRRGRSRCPVRACSPAHNSVAIPALLPDGTVAEGAGHRPGAAAGRADAPPHRPRRSWARPDDALGTLDPHPDERRPHR